MSSDADKRTADQVAADKRTADEAAATAASANWPTGGYNLLTPLLLITMCIVLAISVDASTICLVLHSYMIKYQHVHVMFMIYSWINLIGKLLKYLTTYTVIYSNTLPQSKMGVLRMLRLFRKSKKREMVILW